MASSARWRAPGPAAGRAVPLTRPELERLSSSKFQDLRSYINFPPFIPQVSLEHLSRPSPVQARDLGPGSSQWPASPQLLMLVGRGSQVGQSLAENVALAEWGCGRGSMWGTSSALSVWQTEPEAPSALCPDSSTEWVLCSKF